MKYFVTYYTINADLTVTKDGKYKSAGLKFYLELNIQSAANTQMKYQNVGLEVIKNKERWIHFFLLSIHIT